MSLERGRSRYVGGAPPSHHKIAERITILNKRAPGMLTRLFNLKKQVNEPKNKPDFFKRKDVQPYLQQITKKFPNVGPSQMSFPQIQQGESSMISLFLEKYCVSNLGFSWPKSVCAQAKIQSLYIYSGTRQVQREL